jgi:pilus assembly protein CpaB
MSRLLPIFIALAFAIACGAIALIMLRGGDEKVQEKQIVVEKPVEVIRPEPSKRILIASRYIAPGTVVDATMLERQEWPERLIVDQFLVDGSPQANVIGMVARSPFQPREPLALSKLAKQGDPSFIAATLPNGQRMVTIATDGINGVAGFIYPGDRVDVLLTHQVEIPNTDPRQRNAQPKQEQISEPLLVNVPVIAVDQRATSDTGEKTGLPSSVSLQVTPDDAQKLRLAEKRGSLSLALRSLKDKDEAINAPTTRYDITHFYTPAVAPSEIAEGEDGKPATPAPNPLTAQLPNQSEGVNITVVRGVRSEIVNLEQAN